MKTLSLNILLVCLLVILISTPSFGQDNTVYSFKYGMKVQECDVDGSVAGFSKKTIEKGYLFTIDKITPSGYVITFLKWKDNYKLSSKVTLNNISTSCNDKFVRTATGDQIYFLLSANDFAVAAEKKIRLPKNDVVFGIVNMPIKLRFASELKNGTRDRYFDFNGDVNLGLAVGWKNRPKRNKDWCFNILVGASITSVSVDSLTTNGFIQKSTKASAFTPSLSLIVNFKNVQVGVFTGIDFLARELGDNWDYQNKFWLGVGLGYSIFSHEGKESEQELQIPNPN